MVKPQSKGHLKVTFSYSAYSIQRFLSDFQEEDVKDGKCFVLNTVLPCPLFLSLSVDDADVVDCVIETMKQVSCKLDSLVSFLS